MVTADFCSFAKGNRRAAQTRGPNLAIMPLKTSLQYKIPAISFSAQ